MKPKKERCTHCNKRVLVTYDCSHCCNKFCLKCRLGEIHNCNPVAQKVVVKGSFAPPKLVRL